MVYGSTRPRQQLSSAGICGIKEWEGMDAFASVALHCVLILDFLIDTLEPGLDARASGPAFAFCGQ